MFWRNNDNIKIFKKPIVQKISLSCDEYFKPVVCRENLLHSISDLFSIRNKMHVFEELQ